jgi:tRNA-(MS[2]IO[6]A)-hydroxylase (MiaE)-like
MDASTPTDSPAATRSASSSGVPFRDPAYRAGVIDLLGVIAYGELSAFERLADDAKLAPTLEDKIALVGMASAEFGHLAKLTDRLRELDADPFAAMSPFRLPIDDFHRHTAPRTWLEGLIKAYVGDGLAADFYREVGSLLDEDTRGLIDSSMVDGGHAAFVVQRVRGAIDADPRVAGRLALWGRRLMGEALSQAQRVVADRDGLSALLSGTEDRPGMDLAAIGKMFNRLTERHVARMAELGLDS